MQPKISITVVIIFFLLSFSAWSHGPDESAIDFLHDGEKAPDFTLIDQNEKKISLSDFKGRPIFITFIYTNCPNACPLILQSREEIKEQFGKDLGEKELVFMAITVDPEFDTPKVLKNYAKTLEMDEKDLHLLTGKPEIVRKALHDYGIDHEKNEAEGLVGHSVIGYTINSQGMIDKSILFAF